MHALWLLLALGCGADADGDGYAGREDCDDTDPAVHPGADEVCNDVDDDCDDAVDEDPVDPETWHPDADGDTFGDAGTSLVACTAEGHVLDASDCDDTRDDVYPGADEFCDGVDNDCDGAVDEDPVDGTTWYADTDRDSWGDDDTAVVACQTPTEDHVERGGDCRDDLAEVNPGAEEVCDNGLDDDCDGGPGDCAWTGALAWEDRTGAWWAEWLGVHLDSGAPGVVIGNGASAWVVAAPASGDVILDEEDRIAGVDGGVAAVEDQVVVGSPATGDAGVARVLLGDAEVAALWGDLAGDGAGAGFATGDVDRDGVDDLLVGALGVDGTRFPHYDGEENGAVYLVSGTDLDGDLALGDLQGGIFGTDGEVYLGEAGSFLLADLTGDDRLEAVVGGWGWEGDRGAAWVHVGTGHLWADWVCSCSGESELQGVEGALVGSAVASADLDGDGYGDLVLGGPGGAGGAWVFLGSASGYAEYVALSQADAEILGDVAGGALGASLHADGDLDGDEVDDLVLGWPGHGGGAGAVALLPGGTLGSHDASDLPRLEGPEGGALGTAVLAMPEEGAIIAGAPGAGAVLVLDVPSW